MLGGEAVVSPRHGQDLPPAPAARPAVRESRGRAAEGGEEGRSSSGSPLRPGCALRRRKKRPPGRRGGEHGSSGAGGRDLGDARWRHPGDPPPPRPGPPTRPRGHAPGPGESRSWRGMAGGGGGITIKISPAVRLRPPSPERNAPRADGDGRPGGTGLAGPEPEEGWVFSDGQG